MSHFESNTIIVRIEFSPLGTIDFNNGQINKKRQLSDPISGTKNVSIISAKRSRGSFIYTMSDKKGIFPRSPDCITFVPTQVALPC